MESTWWNWISRTAHQELQSHGSCQWRAEEKAKYSRTCRFRAFATALHHLTVPQDLVGNPERWKYMREKRLQSSPPVLTPQIYPHNVALSSLKRKQKKVRILKLWFLKRRPQWRGKRPRCTNMKRNNRGFKNVSLRKTGNLFNVLSSWNDKPSRRRRIMQS